MDRRNFLKTALATGALTELESARAQPSSKVAYHNDKFHSQSSVCHR